jgi:hypothetical protein
MQADKKKQPEEIGGFNPERPKPTQKPQVGPMPTDDPRNAAAPDLKRKIVREAGKNQGR